MRLSVFFFLLFVAQTFATATYSQETRLTFKMQDAKVIDVLSKIEDESEFFFLFNQKLVNVDRSVSVDVKNESIDKILTKLFENTNVSYLVKDRQIVLTTAIPGTNASTQQKSVSGTVTDSSGGSLPGVSIVVKGTTTGTITDADGKYSLVNVPENSTIQFSFVGMKTQEISISGKSTINATLVEESIGLDEVVAVGYGVVKKSDLTGSVGSVNSDKLLERPTINLEQSIAGRIAGVNVQTNSGRPGGRTVVAIRGYSSVNASNSPLYVVDGIIWPAGINDLNPNDIESIDVLKDASSTAIYGTRGSNGVIIITTKRGNKEIKGQIIYNGYMSVNWLPQDRKQDVLNSKEFLFIEEEQYKNASKYDPTGYAKGKYTDPIVKRKDYLVGNTLGNRELFSLDGNGVAQPIYDVDWQDMSTRTAISQSHNLSYTGGDKLSNYGLFFGYTDENGIIKRSFAERFSIRAVIDRQMLDWLKVGGTFSYARTKDGGINDGNSYNVLREMIEQVPFIPYKYADGTYGTQGDYKGLEKQDSPLAKINENTLSSLANTFSGNTYANVKLISGLEFTSTLGVNISNRINPTFQSSKLTSLRNSAGINSSESTFWQWSNRFNYIRQINDDHGINVLAGIEIQSQDYLGWGVSTSDMPDDYYQWNDLSAGATPSAPSSNTYASRMESYFGRFNYNYKEKYLLTGTGRFDGSSKFGENNKFAFFPSTAVAWRISQEDFLKNNNVISNLKLRFSYGLTGNSEIGSYRSLANLSTNDYIMGR